MFDMIGRVGVEVGGFMRLLERMGLEGKWVDRTAPLSRDS